jgi:hypothetical protein
MIVFFFGMSFATNVPMKKILGMMNLANEDPSSGWTLVLGYVTGKLGR